jgi:hypothetical protein
MSALLHEHGALSFWDFAAAAPYVDIEMTAPVGGDPAAYKDAVFLSPHKFIGGPVDARGARRAARAVRQPGAGRARRGHGRLRQPEEHRFLTDPRTVRRAAPRRSSSRSAPGWSSSSRRRSGSRHPRPRGAVALARRRPPGGPSRPSRSWATSTRERLSIVSFVVTAPSGHWLHHNFVVALLNDLFGMQARGGCSCAGPYGHRLLGIDIERSHEFEREISRRLRGHQARLGAGELQLLHR